MEKLRSYSEFLGYIVSIIFSLSKLAIFVSFLVTWLVLLNYSNAQSVPIADYLSVIPEIVIVGFLTFLLIAFSIFAITLLSLETNILGTSDELSFKHRATIFLELEASRQTRIKWFLYEMCYFLISSILPFALIVILILINASVSDSILPISIYSLGLLLCMRFNPVNRNLMKRLLINQTTRAKVWKVQAKHFFPVMMNILSGIVIFHPLTLVTSLLYVGDHSTNDNNFVLSFSILIGFISFLRILNLVGDLNTLRQAREFTTKNELQAESDSSLIEDEPIFGKPNKNIDRWLSNPRFITSVLVTIIISGVYLNFGTDNFRIIKGAKIGWYETDVAIDKSFLSMIGISTHDEKCSGTPVYCNLTVQVIFNGNEKFIRALYDERKFRVPEGKFILLE